MNQELSLNILAKIMGWDDVRARNEYAWLKLMARLKYDGYRDFQAGMRFIESLATWLQQFLPEERETAYVFMRNSLVYIGPSEMQRLVERFYPHTVRDRLFRTVATQLELPTYQVIGNTKAIAEIDSLKRKTLFIALSDGARIDTVRHTNVGILTNEQLVVATHVDIDKWGDLLKKLRKDRNDPKARFALVYLIDDFMGTGTSFLRFDEDKKKWTGKLLKFQDSFKKAAETFEKDGVFEDSWELCIHHYVASASAAKLVVEREKKARADIAIKGWASAIHFSFGAVLPEELPINAIPGRHTDFIKLTQTYYDSVLLNEHTKVGGVDHLGLGYGGCALPLILEHNTPNNAVALLWAETDGGLREDGSQGRAMRPLFRRRQRHSS